MMHCTCKTSTTLHDAPPIRAPPRTRCAHTGRYASDPTEVRTSDQNVSDDTIAVRKELKTQVAGFASLISPRDLHTIPSHPPTTPSPRPPAAQVADIGRALGLQQQPGAPRTCLSAVALDVCAEARPADAVGGDNAEPFQLQLTPADIVGRRASETTELLPRIRAWMRTPAGEIPGVDATLPIEAVRPARHLLPPHAHATLGAARDTPRVHFRCTAHALRTARALRTAHAPHTRLRTARAPSVGELRLIASPIISCR